MNILSYGCSTSAGAGVSALWNGLQNGIDHSTLQNSVRSCVFNREHFQNSRQFLSDKLFEAYQECISGFDGNLTSDNVGVIFASTKGCTDDFVWSGDKVSHDPLMPVL